MEYPVIVMQIIKVRILSTPQICARWDVSGILLPEIRLCRVKFHKADNYELDISHKRC